MLRPFVGTPSATTLLGVLSEVVLCLTGLFLPTHPPLPLLVQMEGVGGVKNELNFESCSASTRIVHSRVLQRH